MEVREAIKTRRSVRKFTNEPVDAEDLEAIIEAALWAPSATNTQPWFFLALTREEDCAWVLAELRQHRERQREQLSKRFSDHPQVVEETLGFMDTLGGAPVIVLCFLREASNDGKGLARVQSVAAAMENMLLAAWDRKIASCWVEDIARIDAAAREHFSLETGPLLGCVALGHAAYEPRTIKRKPGRYEIR